MNVKVTPTKSGRHNISIVEQHWENGKARMRTVKGFGYLDLLEKEHPDARAYVQGICDELNAKKAKEKQSVEITIHPLEKIDTSQEDFKNIGVVVPLYYYNMLGLEKVLRNHSAARSFAYDINAILRLLVLERLREPGSKLSAWENKRHHFFRCDFSDDDVYRALGFIQEHKSNLVSAMNKAISAHHARNLKDVYYDVTNYYFEIDDEDDLRRRGVSKEHRKDPIVQMGLLQDKDGIPMGFDLFAGNTNDCLTLMPVMKDLRRELRCKRMVMVADKGLNTSDNIAAIALDGNGFVFSQSIRGTKSTDELRRWVISQGGYRLRPEDEDGSDFKRKSRQDTKTIHVIDSKGKAKDVAMDVKVVAFWSSKYDRRAKHEREKVLEKARRLVECPASYDRAMHYGAAKYVKNVTVDKKTGEMYADVGKMAMLDEDLIAKEAECDGYYCIITSEVGLSDDKIIEIYRGLWKIEESFKLTKSCLRARPVYLTLADHIAAHFLICYISLCITRLMQYDTGFAYSAEAMLEEIRQMNGVHLEDNWWRFYHRSELSDCLGRIAGVDLTRKNMRLTEIKQLISQVKKRQITDGKKLASQYS